MKVVICADKAPTAPYYLFGELLASLKRFGHEPLILGWGLPWTGLGAKPRLLKAAIESGRITDERIVFADAYDVIFAAAPEFIGEVATEFFGDKICFNAERACFPDASLADKHPECGTSYRYLNSGFSVGKTEDYLTCLKWMKADEIPDDSRNPDGSGNHPNDQLFFQQAFLSGELPMVLDTRACICQTLCGVTAEELDFTGEFIENRETRMFPAALHANGNAKSSGIIEPILRKLGLR